MADTIYNHSRMLANRLGRAIDNGGLECVRMRIEQGVDVNKPCYSETYPLALACLRGHEEIMKELLKAGADPNQVSGRWSQPAMVIAAEQSVLTLSMMRCLISHGADVNLRGNRGKNIFYYLARGEFNDTHDNLLSAAKLVLENGASFNARDRFGHTPLYEACKWGNIDLAKLCIAEGADVNSDIGDKTMLRVAADVRNIEMFDLLLNVGANRHLNPDALANPCDQNDHDMIARILDTCDVDINLEMRERDEAILMCRCDPPVRTILHHACYGRSITSNTVRLLLDRGADVGAVSNTGDTALHYAVKKCNCNKIRQLVSYNPPLNIKNNKNQTPLAKLIEIFIKSYSLSLQQGYTQDHIDYATDVYQAGLLAFKMLVTAGATSTADDEHKLNKFRIKHPEAQLPDYEVRSTRSLKEMCRFVIRETIPVPVDVSLSKLPIPKLLQEYLSFPEFDRLANTYTIYSNIWKEDALERFLQRL